MEATGESYYIELSNNPVRFEAINEEGNVHVFFDESNKQVFVVRSNGTSVVVKAFEERKNISFRLTENEKSLVSIKLSPDLKVLALQRVDKSVEFLNFAEGKPLDQVEYSQSCKGKCKKIYRFYWVSYNEIIFVTDNGIDHYQLLADKKQLKLLKSYSVVVNWFVWLAERSVLLLSTGVLGNILHPFFIKQGLLMKVAKFEVDLPIITKPPKLTLLERDVTLGVIYDELYVLVLKYQPRTAATNAITTEIALYKIYKEGPARKSHILKLNLGGQFATNIVDNLIVVHHQASRTSMVFDIQVGGESDGYVTSHVPILPPLPIRPFKLRIPILPTLSGASAEDFNCELYSLSWRIFQPDIVIDAKLGNLWRLQLRLEPMVSMIPDKCHLVDLLLLRSNSKSVIMSVCQDMVTPQYQASLTVIGSIFDKLNRVYYQGLNAEVQALALESNPFNGDSLRPRSVQTFIDQSAMYTGVFSKFVENKDISAKFMIAVLVEYIRSLQQFQIVVQHYLYELVINSLVHQKHYYQLHQFLQYHAVSDSKPLACLLLSLQSDYPPAHQLALDMLKRLGTANDEILEVLLSNHQLFPALRFIRSIGMIDQVSARKFLEAATNSGDPMVFYTVYKFFEQRNVRLRGDPKFPPGAHCEQSVEHFVKLFGKEALGSGPL